MSRNQSLSQKLCSRIYSESKIFSKSIKSSHNLVISFIIISRLRIFVHVHRWLTLKWASFHYYRDQCWSKHAVFFRTVDSFKLHSLRTGLISVHFLLRPQTTRIVAILNDFISYGEKKNVCQSNTNHREIRTKIISQIKSFRKVSHRFFFSRCNKGWFECLSETKNEAAFIVI